MSLSKSCLSTEVVDSRLVIRDWYVPSCAVIREPITSAGFLVVDARETSPNGGDMVKVKNNTATQSQNNHHADKLIQTFFQFRQEMLSKLTDFYYSSNTETKTS